MAAYESTGLAASPINGIPLLDASCLPSAEDWALLEAIQGGIESDLDFEPGFDRGGRLRLAAAFDD